MYLHNKIIILLIILILFIINKFEYQENFNDFKYTAVIIEPREHKALNFVLDNFLKNLSDEWKILIMHGNQNYNFVNKMVNNHLYNYKNRISLINLNVDNLSLEEYSKLLVSEDFYNMIPTDTFLIFQTDSIICEKNKELLNNYLNYEYVGAPWAHHDNKVGNGGLSLRKKAKCIDKIKTCEYNDEAEDLYFTNECSEMNMPLFEEAKNFSVETIFDEKTFAVHKPWAFLEDNELNCLNDNCKDLDILIELNK